MERLPAHRSLSPKLLFVCLLAAFLLLRLPVAFLQPGGQDEDCYAVPGLTILQNGIPRLPHAPAENSESVFFHADKALYCEPPLYFYYQAIFYLVFPVCYGTARLSSMFAGLLSVLLVYYLQRKAGGSEWAAFWGAGLFLFSRWFYFPAMSARPDLLCTMFGLLSIVCMFRWNESNKTGWLWLASVAIGAGGMTHPFALVYAIQMAVWAIWKSKGKGRLVHPLILTSGALLVTSLWIPLIAIYPEAFSVQFKNQFLGGGEEGLLLRMVWPWKSLWYHSFYEYGMFYHLGAWQYCFPIVMTIGCFFVPKLRQSSISAIAVLGLSSLYLMSVLVGPHHPVNGYWSYSASLLFICVGAMLQFTIDRITAQWRERRADALRLGVAMLALVSWIPGAGFTTLKVHLQHWKDENYNSPAFAKELMRNLPTDAIVAVDTQFLLDFLADDRKVLLAQTLPVYFRLDQVPFDYLVVSRSGKLTNIAESLPVELISRHGNEGDKFACYAEIYRRTDIETDRRSTE
jgi:4-amino-4-deoxy-L-arabinose transferase-like glycosyltransferase